MIHKSRCKEQPYEVALLEDYQPEKPDGIIHFLNKPTCITRSHDRANGDIIVDIYWDYYYPYIDHLNASKFQIFLGIVGTDVVTNKISTCVCAIIQIEKTFEKCVCRCRQINPVCKDFSDRLIAEYKNFLGRYFSGIFPTHVDKKIDCDSITTAALNIDDLNVDYSSFSKDPIFNKTTIKMGDTMLALIPSITRCIINDPAVVVFWSDGSKTIGKCIDTDEFNPEIGLAMAISRKYYQIMRYTHPRSAFKNEIKNAENHSAKTEKRKQKLLVAAKDSDND